MTKHAVMVGCNYPGSQAELKGCINDVKNMKQMLINKFGFQPNNMKIMLDTDSKTTKPTGRNIKSALKAMVSKCRPGDVAFFHFSGHGTQVPARADSNEADGKDEAIVPTDLNIIIDDDLQMIFAKLDKAVKLTVICDCCHSGTMLDHKEVQIHGTKDLPPGLFAGQSQSRAFTGPVEIKARDLPVEMLMSMLAQTSGHQVGAGNLGTTLFQMFGNNSSLMAVQSTAMLNQLKPGGLLHNMLPPQLRPVAGPIVDLIGKVLKFFPNILQQAAPFLPNPAAKPNLQGAPIQGSPPKIGDDVGVLITGCQSHETSADAHPAFGEPHGALTNAILDVCNNTSGPVSYRGVVTGVRQSLKRGGFTQNPCLECSEHLADTTFVDH